MKIFWWVIDKYHACIARTSSLCHKDSMDDIQTKKTTQKISKNR